MLKFMALGLLTALAFGCEARPDVSAPLSYEDDGIIFSYPGNWEVTEAERERIEDLEYATIVVESPGSAIATLSVFYGGSDLAITAQSFSEDAEEARITEMNEMLGAAKSLATLGKTKVSREPSRTKASAEEQIVHNYTISLLGESVPHRGEFHRIVGESSLAVTYFQVAEEDREKVDPGFALIYESLRVK